MKGDPFGSEPELGQRSKYQQEKHVIHSRLWSLPITPGSIVVPHTHSREDEVTYVIEGQIGVKMEIKWSPRRQGLTFSSPEMSLTLSGIPGQGTHGHLR